MSASEKLKALDAAMPIRKTPFIIYDSATGVTEEIAKAHLRYREVLPQIIAVIAEAERQIAESHPDDVDLELATALVLLAGVLS